MSQQLDEISEAKTPVFRKKTARGARPKTTRKSDGGDDSPDEDEVKQLDLVMIKAQQILRGKNKRIPTAASDDLEKKFKSKCNQF